MQIVAPLAADDCNIQPMPDVSPPKWHLAHSSWFFETFLLKNFCKNYKPFHERYEYLFNSYYNGVGEQYPRAARGFLSRPPLDDIFKYREHTDEKMCELISRGLDEKALYLLILGLHHEEQHQELLLTDIKYILGRGPLCDAYRSLPGPASNNTVRAAPGWLEQDGGVYSVGCDPVRPGSRHEFVFDNETPASEVILQPFALADRQVTCGEYLAFMEAGGYQKPQLWLADGWASVQQENWQGPLYWEQKDNDWYCYTLGGLHPLDPAAPVCHVSYYEADAYARWAGCRLPGEFEWELLARRFSPDGGNFLESDCLMPVPGSGADFFGNVWEWTQSAYSPYPGFKTAEGAVGEYNGKFMCSQMVLRGGSCFTPAGHIRLTYRNFFYPSARWQMSGIRLAMDAV